jgi:two-component system, chemotaxis family, sensor kinase CheA
MTEAFQKEVLNELLVESAEGLDRFEQMLLKLEEGGGDSDTPNALFRVIHSLKGSAGFLSLHGIEGLAHVGENLLGAYREGKVAVSKPFVSTLLECGDALRKILRSIEETGAEGEFDFSNLKSRLEAIQTAGAVPVAANEAKPVWGLFGDDAPETPSSAAPKYVPGDGTAFGLFEADAAAPAADIPAPAKVPQPVIKEGVTFGLFDDAAAVPAAAAPAPAPAAAKPVETPASAGKSSVAETAIRVDVGQLDKLMNLVGELVLARNQILQHSSGAKDPALVAASQRINLITTELQESVMKTRMQPIGNVWAKFPRVVRDVAGELGKSVQLVMEGQETELDRTIIEAIKDPLTHIIRNSIDHGIESPDRRSAKGKSAEGRLLLRAFHEGGQVNVEIRDDGAGINVDRCKQKALEKGLITAEQAAKMSDREAWNLVFLPGFSTAEKVSNISGRGVGMDVVRTNIEKIGGSVDIHSEKDRGTTLRIKIPLTLAIVPALLVTAGAERFAIPQVSLVELVRLEGEQARKGIEKVMGAPVYRLRGTLLPLVYLDRVLELEVRDGTREALNIVVLQADGQQFGLVVDKVNDTQEIVVKPLGKHLKGIAAFAGATIMGDGRVALILDVPGIAQQASVFSQSSERAREAKVAAGTGAVANDQQTLLLFSVGAADRMAIPLNSVGRLEQLPSRDVEYSGGQEVIQYRGQIMPLVRLSNVFNTVAATDESDTLPVVVYTRQGRSVGLVVGRILDIVEDRVVLEKRGRSRGNGILGSAVIQGRVTELLDLPAVVQQAEPEVIEFAQAA